MAPSIHRTVVAMALGRPMASLMHRTCAIAALVHNIFRVQTSSVSRIWAGCDAGTSDGQSAAVAGAPGADDDAATT